MEVISRCRLRVGHLAWQTRAGTPVLTVACKATYRLLPTESPLAEEQDELSEEDTFWNDDETRSLSVVSDLAPFKARADVLVIGHAFVPMGQPVRTLSARLRVGDVDKTIEVWCDRGFGHNGQLLEGRRFTKMSLRYERAAGGPDTSNPAGMRFDAPPDMYGMVAIPNLQPPGCHVAWRGDTFDPIGFGPIAPTWPGRAEKLYGHASGWSHKRWFERPLPDDIDPGYFNAAPRDQQVDGIRTNERLVLEGLHPGYTRLVTSLTDVRPHVVAERQGQGREEVALVCDTLLIDTDRSVCTLVWRGRIGLRHPDEEGRVLVTDEPVGSGSSARAAVNGPLVSPALFKERLAIELPKASFGAMDGMRISTAGVGAVDPTATLVPTPEQATGAARAPAMPFEKQTPGRTARTRELESRSRAEARSISRRS